MTLTPRTTPRSSTPFRKAPPAVAGPFACPGRLIDSNAWHLRRRRSRSPVRTASARCGSRVRAACSGPTSASRSCDYAHVPRRRRRRVRRRERRPPGGAPALSRRRRRRAVLLEEPAQGRAGVDPHHRRDLPERSRAPDARHRRAGRRRLDGADEHDRVPPVAVPRRRHRPPRISCASTSTRSPARTFGMRSPPPLELRNVLEEAGLAAFVKTSGNRGLHVYAPIEPTHDFIGVRHAVISAARELERRMPDAVTTAWWKEERGERVFVDFNQAARDRTIAARLQRPRAAGCDGLDTAGLGRGGARPRLDVVHGAERSRRASPSAATRGPTSRRAAARSTCFSSGGSATSRTARASCRIRPSIRRCRGSRCACSRAAPRSRPTSSAPR